MAGENELADEDRLPWLETVDDDYDDGPSPLRIALLVLLGLAILAAIVFAYFRSQQHAAGPDGQGQIIAAQPGDYKVKPDQPGGMKVEGQGDTAFATSQGKGSGDGAIDLNAVPETPVQGKQATARPAAPGTTSSTSTAAIPSAATPLNAGGAAHKATTTPGGAGGGAIVQLGAFPTEAAANAAWDAMAKRFGYLAPLGKVVQPAQVGNGTTYRLRVNAGSADQAATLCGKLKVAGEACFVPQS